MMRFTRILAHVTQLLRTCETVIELIKQLEFKGATKDIGIREV